jgi:hypothetical protein
MHENDVGRGSKLPICIIVIVVWDQSFARIFLFLRVMLSFWLRVFSGD